MNIERVFVTPDMASEWLKHNHSNRNCRDRQWRAYQRDMEAGNWPETGDPIRIAKDGNIIDGQHRLTALANSSIDGLWMLVIKDMDPDVQRYLDQGAVRTPVDALKMEFGDITNITNVASVLRWINSAPEPVLATKNALGQKVSTSEIVDGYRRNPDVERAVQRALSLRSTMDGISITAMAYCYLFLNRIDTEAAEQYWYALTETAFTGPSDPRRAAWRRLVSVSKEGIKQGHDVSSGVISVVMRSWNAWRKGEEMDSIMIRNSNGYIKPVNPV